MLTTTALVLIMTMTPSFTSTPILPTPTATATPVMVSENKAVDACMKIASKAYDEGYEAGSQAQYCFTLCNMLPVYKDLKAPEALASLAKKIKKEQCKCTK